ncbi:MAG: diguanylate cyclase, partial [Gammaproteobacteria bacterium]|nr:diguanylate cyclase [Gammaproteobacteria bacterium]
DETNWISDNPNVRFGYVAARAPFEFINQHNNMEGINRTTLDLIADKTGLMFTFHPYPAAGKLLAALYSNDVDVISSVYEQSSHWGNLNLTQPYWDSSIAAISRNGEIYLNLTEMKGKVIAINANSSYRQYLQEMLPQASLVEVDSVARGVKSVADGDAQVYIGNILMAAQEIRENTYSNLTINIIDSVPLANPRFAIRNDWQPLVNIFDKAVLKITATERLTLFEQWLKYSLTVEAKYRELIDFIIPISILLFGVFFCFVYWNKRLINEIKLRTQLQSKFEYQAKHDELTGLPNRAQLKEAIKEKLLSHHQRDERLLCLFIDLNGFKAINDSYGHDVGDILLIQFSRRLSNHLRHQDFVSRFGGDEFIVLASLNDSQQGSEAITKMVRSLYKHPIIIENFSIKVSCSIGGAVFPEDGTTFEQLIKIADQRMYVEKNNKSLDNITRVSFR